MRLAIPGLAITLAMVTIAQAQTPIPVGGEFLVNTYTTYEQRTPAIAMTPGGDFIVVWTSELQDGDDLGVFGQRFDHEGLPEGGEFQVNTYTTHRQQFADVSLANDGAIVVVWRTYDPTGAWVEIFARLFDPSGSPEGDEFQVNTYTYHFQRQPAVATDGDGDFVIVWSDYTLDGGCCGGVFARLYDATGTPQGDQFQVNTYTTGGQGMPDVAMSPGGEFVVVWAGRGEEDDGGIFGRRFGAAGVPFDGDFNINTYTTNRQSQPSVASDGEGAFVVVWSSDDQIAADLDVFGQRFDAKGVRVGDEFLVNTYTTLHQDSPQVSMDSVGNFVVVWDSSDQVDTTGVFAQHFNADGTASGSEFQLNTYTTSWQRGAGVAATAGGFVVSWEGRGQGDTTGIFGQRFLAGVTFLDGFESGDTSTWSSMVQ